MTSIVHPSGVIDSTTITWGEKGLYSVSTLSTGKPSTITHYDALGREIRTGNQRFDGQWQYVDMEYDSYGRSYKTSLPFKGTSATQWSSYNYDSYNRPTKLTEASGKITSWTYSGLSTTETNNSIATTRTMDVSGALVSVSDPGGTITYTLRPDGQPSSITAPGGVVTSFEYDAFGRQTALVDPSAGRQTSAYSYTVAGVLTLTETSPKGTNISVFDKYGRITSLQRQGEFTTTYGYSVDGLLANETSTNGTSKTFTYDIYDRLLTEKETVPDSKWLQKTYTYSGGNVSSVQYSAQSGTLATENFVYANGYNTEIKLNGSTTIWKLTAENALGQPTSATTGNMSRSYNYNAYGVSTGRTAGSIQNFTYSFDVQKGNLLSRTDNRYSKTETFSYDNLNRLTGAAGNTITYAANGNITRIQGVGTMTYGNSARPYQVTMLSPEGSAVPLRNQSVAYTSFLRPSRIDENGLSASFIYNSTGERVKMYVANGTTPVLTRYYIGGQYELDAPSNTERLYLGGNVYSAPAVYVKEGGNWKIYYICRDYLGSITHIANTNGEKLYEYSYDAWGRLRNPSTQVAYAPGNEPALFLGRGYIGHEYLPWFGLVNMNARLYDPALGRFLSPDPNVQMTDFTQNFNRYSYCLNNPLLYIDQDGESFILVAAIIGAWIGMGQAMINSDKSGWGLAGDMFKGALTGGAAGAAGAWAGGAVSGALNFGGFFGGAVSGGAGGGLSGFIGGSGNAWLLQGANFGQGLSAGLIGGGIGLASGALLGGLSNGIHASRNHGDFWTGKGTILASYGDPKLRPEDVKVGKDVEFSSDFAKKVADETYTKLDYVKDMNTNKVPSKGGYTIKNGSILDAKGRIIDGLTESLGKGNSAVYLSKSTFVSMDQLKMTIGHEYIHATHNFMASRGILNANAKHEGILWTEISAHHWENHVWGVQNGYGIYERQLGRFHWWRKDYFGWLLNAKY